MRSAGTLLEIPPVGQAVFLSGIDAALSPSEFPQTCPHFFLMGFTTYFSPCLLILIPSDGRSIYEEACSGILH